MKTARSAPPVHSGQYQYLPSKSTTPLTSPRMMVHSVGQQCPPKLSPRHTPGPVSIPRQSPGASKDCGSGSSPSYFGLVVEPSTDLRDSVAAPRDNWGSPSPSVKSFSITVPKQAVPLDANPAFDAFRKQADVGHITRSFSLNTGQFISGKMPLGTPQLDMMTSVTSVSPARPLPPRRTTQDSGSGIRASGSVQVPPYSGFFHLGGSNSSYDGSRPASAQTDVDGDTNSMHDSAYMSSESKRNSEASIDPPFFPAGPRFESPKQMETAAEPRPTMPPPSCNVRFPPNLGRHSLSLPKGGVLGAGPVPARAETAPANLADSIQGATLIGPKQLSNLLKGDEAASASGKCSILLLDIRVSTYFALSRIRNALNMCIPTTLLKRPTFNVEKMRLTFVNPDQLARFSSWNETQHIVVYDNSLAEGRDSTAAANMLRKFTNEGYKGKACILRGGFKAFAEEFPDLVDDNKSSSVAAPGGSAALSLGAGGPQRLSIAPVIGGVVLPAAQAAVNPFFSNIRQNMDLADGVGRIELNLPSGVIVETLPSWLREAADPADHGSKVSNKFLRIELAEKARMEHAFGVIRSASDVSSKVQLCGVEKGVKNRYKDILPFEHARVRLQGRPVGDCDYVNASHLRASRTNKRYIASQAPLPDTYSDFWSMIWDEDVRVIVMLTAESEGGQIKCHPYWKETEYGNLTLRLTSETKVSLDVEQCRFSATASGATGTHAPAFELGRRRAQTLVPAEGGEHASPAASLRATQATAQSDEPAFVVVRKFALGHRGHASAPIREITQLHYASWPDFGTPAQPSHLLALVELANMVQRADSPTAQKQLLHQQLQQKPGGMLGADTTKLEHIPWPCNDEAERRANPRPMLVHCSAGCGRTGTFCTVDSVVDMLKQQSQRSVQRAQARAEEGSSGAEPGPAAAAAASEDVSMSGTDDYLSATSADKSASAWLDGDAVDLVAGTVEDFRTQRISMVQTLKQYVLCYETIAEYVSKMQDRRGGGGPKSA